MKVRFLLPPILVLDLTCAGTVNAMFMNTFLPSPDFSESAKILDFKRLNNQINEAKIIYYTITGVYPKGKGWPNHPATKMWIGYPNLLAAYFFTCLLESKFRINSQLLINKINSCIAQAYKKNNGINPWWLGKEELHAAYRSCLLYKDPDYYGKFKWKETAAKPNHKGQLPYYWPTQHLNECLSEEKEKQTADHDSYVAFLRLP